MALQTFTAGQVLTAAQVTALQANDYNQTVNNYTDSRVLTIADLGDRVVMNKATATTITVNTGIFAAGDTLWIHNIGAGVTTITAGTATVSSSGSLALAQNAGGTLYFTSTGVAIFFPTVASSAQGLTLLNTTAFSAVASQSFNDVFSTTYDNYRIVFEATCSANVTIDMRLRVSGADNSSANYWNNRTLGAGSTPQSFGASSAETAWLRVGEFETGISTGTYDIYSPFKTQITSLAGVNQFRYTSVYQHSCMKTGQTTVTTSYTGFTLFPSSGTMTGTVSVYGYNK